jgi:hypothetical protein
MAGFTKVLTARKYKGHEAVGMTARKYTGHEAVGMTARKFNRP